MKSFEIECPKCDYKFSADASLNKHAGEEAAKQVAIIKQKAAERESEIQEREQRLREQEDLFQGKVKSEVEKEKVKIAKLEEEKAAEKVAVQLKDLQAQIKEKDKSLIDSNEAQLQTLKKVRDLEKREKEMDLEVAKKVSQETSLIETELRRTNEEKNKFELAQRDKKIQEMSTVIEELNKKSQQGSQQTQGEVVEEEFEAALRAKFPQDSFSPIAKGVSGADLKQDVLEHGKISGSILYEFKNQKAFSKAWIEKLREDQRRVGASIAVLVTNVMPKEYEGIEVVDGIYVVSYDIAIPFSVTLRMGLQELARTALISTSKDEKMTHMYDYLTGHSFRQKFKSILLAYKTQKDDLNKEKRALNKIWSRREKQLEIVIESASSMFGDIEGIIGKDIPPFDELALPEGDADLFEDTETSGDYQ